MSTRCYSLHRNDGRVKAIYGTYVIKNNPHPIQDLQCLSKNVAAKHARENMNLAA